MNLFNQNYLEQFLLKTNNFLNKKKIVVTLGAPSNFKEKLDSSLFVDYETYGSENATESFNKNWAANVFTKLHTSEGPCIISFAQYAYLSSEINADFFAERLVLVKDNLRMLYPLNDGRFLEKQEFEGIEKRPENLPIHQSEQLKAGKNYYYITEEAIGFKTVVNVFEEKKQCKSVKHSPLEVLDHLTDRYAIDKFISDCLTGIRQPSSVAFKIQSKKADLKDELDSIERFNWLLSQLGFEAVVIEDTAVVEQLEVSKETIKTLKHYWGEKAEFRNIRLYKSPNTTKEIQEVSQGQIVQTILDEYNNSKNNKTVRDLFLTAPTGSGKSLLFQLPAFEISKKGDVTIVVSPLIALMKDQVIAIQNDRNFDKVTYLNSELSLIDRERLLSQCHNGEIDVLYLSPELLLSYDIKHFIGERNLGLLVIDEAHLITTWGRDFRVDYWFLGNHIRKIKRFNDLNFPVVAVTATAIFGGSNDMVFDTIDSLNMQDPHMFIGEVKRNDIKFLVNNYDEFESGYDRKKIEQTVNFIKQVGLNTNLKTLVYTPYEKHVRKLIEALQTEKIDFATGYYGRLDKDVKQHAYDEFKSGKKQIMISTKAFGMGVDIPDIEVVYHHAPSGLLPDYVQEIGRLARDPKLNGYATLNYSSKDQIYSKKLYGMSAIRRNQLIEVLKKISKAYNLSKSRNLLLSVDDFAHIFPDSDQLDQKVLTSLMMIEKDYLNKTKFNVIVARPKKLFVKVFARVNSNDHEVLNKKYSSFLKVKNAEKNNDLIIELDLDKIWEKHYRDQNFAVIKHNFYKNKLFSKENISASPQLRAEFELTVSFENAANKLSNILKTLGSALSEMQGFFTKDVYLEALIRLGIEESIAKKLAQFVLSNYSGRVKPNGYMEDNAFIQWKRVKNEYQYLVRGGSKYLFEFNVYQKTIFRLFSNNETNKAFRYVTNRHANAVKYSRLGYLFEILDIGLFEIKGGENPMVFIRINDPKRVERDANIYYKNSILKKTKDRHYLSNQIFDHFFLRYFDNDTRWTFIEDFFLGNDVDELKEIYPGEEQQRVDIIKELKAVKKTTGLNNNIEPKGIKNEFSPNEGSYYNFNNLITLESNGKKETLTVQKWLVKDPVAFNEAYSNHKLKLDSEVFKVLASKLRADHSDYLDQKLGSKKKIQFPGIEGYVKALVPLKNEPLKFYKWWSKNPNQVNLSFREKIELFNKVYYESKSTLLIKHKNLINKS